MNRDEEFEEILRKVTAALRHIGVDIDELEPCVIYLKYLNHKLTYIERVLYSLQEKIIFIENICRKNRKETHK